MGVLTSLITSAKQNVTSLLVAIRTCLWTRWQLLAVVVIYFAAIWMAGHHRIGRWAETSYVAAGDLGPNHLLRADDFARPASGAGAWGWFLPDRDVILGQYVTNGVLKGQPIVPKDLRSSPNPHTAAGRRPVFFPLERQPELSAFLNAGASVDVVGADAKPVIPRAPVHAVVCPKSGEPKTCYAILAVPNGKEPDVTGDKRGRLRLIPVE